MCSGQGPLTPWQMFAMGIIGFLAGLLFRKGLLRGNWARLCVFGALAAILIYGGIMNWHPPSPGWESSMKKGPADYISDSPSTVSRRLPTWSFLWFGAEPHAGEAGPH